MIYAQPGQAGSIVSVAARYENYINGKWQPPVAGEYFGVCLFSAIYCGGDAAIRGGR